MNVPLWFVVLVLLLNLITMIVLITSIAVKLTIKILIATILSTSLQLGLITWLIYAGTQPKEIDYTELLPTTKVIYPSGKIIQMFSVDNQDINANLLFSCLIPDNALIEHTVYKKTYAYIDYYGTQSIKDKYAIKW